MSVTTARSGPSVMPDTIDRAAGAAGTEDGDLALIESMSVHLAAFDRAVLPAVTERVGDGPARAAELRRSARDLARALHWWDRRLTGDARVAGWPADRFSEEVSAASARHARSERSLAGALAETLAGDEMAELSRSYHRASLQAPTRPHPRLSFRGRGGRIAFRLAARIDAVRDGIDNRSPGSVRVRAAEALRGLDATPAADAPADAGRAAAVTATGPAGRDEGGG